MNPSDKVNALAVIHELEGNELAVLALLSGYQTILNFCDSRLNGIESETEKRVLNERVVEVELKIAELTANASDRLIDAYAELREEQQELWAIPDQ